MSRVVAVRLSEAEWNAFREVCNRNTVTFQAMLHAIVIDALADEGWDALRCDESSGCEGSTETGEGCRSAASGDS